MAEFAVYALGSQPAINRKHNPAEIISCPVIFFKVSDVSSEKVSSLERHPYHGAPCSSYTLYTAAEPQKYISTITIHWERFLSTRKPRLGEIEMRIVKLSIPKIYYPFNLVPF